MSKRIWKWEGNWNHSHILPFELVIRDLKQTGGLTDVNLCYQGFRLGKPMIIKILTPVDSKLQPYMCSSKKNGILRLYVKKSPQITIQIINTSFSQIFGQ